MLILTDLKAPKQTGWCKVFLVFDRRLAVTFGCANQVGGKPQFSLMRRVLKASTKENQTDQQQIALEENRRVQFNKEIEEWTRLIGNQQSKNEHQSGNSNAISRDQLLSTADKYKSFLDFVREVNNKRSLGYKKIKNSHRPNKPKILYKQTVHLPE